MKLINQDLLNELFALREKGTPVSDLALNQALKADLTGFEEFSLPELAKSWADLYKIEGWKNP